jgi:hypothetical protein
MYYIQKIKWQPGRVTTIHHGPYEKREDAVTFLKSIRKNKHTDYSIIEKELATNDA